VGSRKDLRESNRTGWEKADNSGKKKKNRTAEESNMQGMKREDKMAMRRA
jgi:hypothetical protein